LVNPASLIHGQLFDLPDGEEANFTKVQDATQDSKVTISIVAILGKPGFSPAIITGSPGQVLTVTVTQADDASANFQHNFSIDHLNIDKDVPQGAGHSIKVKVTLPESGALEFYCKYHISEQHGGLFVVNK
jgi:plastocyanin